ncbi:2-dehydro-3-deoxygalactonokinase [Alteromonas sp. KUL49]|uniref:2-dehydro-3-deoxygalactonokinase n=1 Tax=Alteromonas sp. KUL49 TaxID=2480798 RepID=UPI00102EDF9C|nr:2-dehydro-3-deoxygalactonokinase [Alteromonas sp. KUL49]TAP33827.1 2-dehydro-3-deoxygalactonokinase [Alteromonas sp. KUL49]GEA13690.1 2-oxo-3-deoxygalactonate kinase [Alteromonas sp. KUL49]
MNIAVSPHYLIIDWGTTNFRAFSMTENHTLIDSIARPMGLLQVPDGDFATALEHTLSEWLGDYQNLPIYMAGMVGSMKGWVNVPYASTPTSPRALVDGAYELSLPWGSKGVIFPGVSHSYESDKYDVMRGEEVQIFGLSNIKDKGNFSAILPGTHSKHALFEEGELTHFASFLTGEFFSVLVNHTLLGSGLSLSSECDQESFAKGVADSGSGLLTNRVFLGWTHRLFEQLKVEQVGDYLSGMLIGYELRECSKEFVYLVGGDTLCARYQLAADYLDIETEIVSGDLTFLSGMIRLIKEVNSENS